MSRDQLVFDFELKIHPQYLEARIQKHIEDMTHNLK